MRRNRLKTIALVALLLVTCRAFALPLWELEGTQNSITLLGSVHFLRASDHPLPDAITTAYEHADVLILEIDLSSLDLLETHAVMQRLAVDSDGRDLEQILGHRQFAEAQKLANDADIDLTTLRAFEPWFAALQITQLRLMQLGFDGSYGVESQMMIRAVTDGKPMRGLETLDEQFNALDSLPEDAQAQFLMTTLEDAADIGDGLDRIVAAWKTGNTEILQTELADGIEDQPLLYDRLLVRRNRAWTKQIIDLKDDGKNYIIVVGALHLVGDDSVLSMLEEEGISSRQIR